MNCLFCTVTDRNHLTVHIYSYDRHMIVHMTGLYTRLVTYAKLQILTSVVCLQLSFICNLVHVIVIQLFFIFSFKLNVILYYARALFFSYTLIRSLLDDPGFVSPDTRYFMLLIRCSIRLDMLRGIGVSLF